MREGELIGKLRQRVRRPEQLDDDCCTWQPGATSCLSIDSMVEGRHFASDDDPRLIGRKAAGAALSDLAAMGARPVGAVVALHAPAHCDVLPVMDGLADELERHDCPLLGGDSCGAEQLVLSVCVWGEQLPDGRLLRRAGAGPGDLLLVTGALGGSLPSGRHLRPEPRFAAGQWFAGQDAAHAMMDLSDGLAIDAPRLARASSCGCVLLPTEVPIHPDVRDDDALRHACCDGEDFELLIAIEAAAWPRMAGDWPFRELPLTRVGWLIDEPDMLIEDERGRLAPLPWTGYEHEIGR